MRRREFMTLLSSAAVTRPFAARAQQPAMQVIGFLHIAAIGYVRQMALGLTQGLKEAGYVEGQNITI